MEGSRGGGKSTALRFDAHMRCLSYEGFKALIIRRVMPELKKSHLIYVGREAELLGGRYNRSEYTVRYPETDSLLMFGHAEDDRAVEKYLSSEWDWIGFDEIVTFNLREFLLISASARTKTEAGRIALVRGGTNPVGRGAKWVKQFFLEKNPSYEEAPDYDPSDWRAIHMDIDDLTDESGQPLVDIASYEKRLMSLPSEALRRAYRHGEWVSEGAAFDEFRETRDGRAWHVIDELPRIKGVPITQLKWVEIVRAVDWGYSSTGNPGLCIWAACLPDHSIVVFDEYYFRGTLPGDVAEEIKRRSAGMKVRYTVADPAMFREHTGESLAETFAAHGVPLIDGDNERKSGWVRLHAWLRETVSDGVTERPRLQIYRSLTGAGCPGVARTLPEMVVNPKDPEDIETRGVEDEAADCLRYLVMSRVAPSKAPPVDAGVQEALAMIRQLRRKQSNQSLVGSESVRR
jgi:phage terminase large subunit